MANLTETSEFTAGIYQIETSDPVVGGPGGTSNLQPQQLANRTKYLKDHVDALEDGTNVPPGIATQTYVQAELEKLDHKQSARVATTANITLSGVQTIDGVGLAVGNRVLVKNQVLAQQNGIYVVATGAWARAVDANDSADVTAGLVVAIEEGAAHGNSRWQLTTDNPIVLGTTLLTFADVSAGYAPINSPALAGNPTAPTAPSGTNDTTIANTAFVENATGGIVNISVAGSAADINLTDVQAGAAIILLTGARTAALNLNFPAQSGQWIVVNRATGSFNITAKTPLGTGVVMPVDNAALIYGDATNIGFAASPSTASFKRQTITGVTGTTLAVSGGYVPGNLMIEKDGVLLAASDFTATNGSTVTLTAAAVSGDVFTVYAFASFTVANALLKSGDNMAGPLLLAADPTVALAAATKQYVDGVKSLADPGYVKFPNGLIVQWGSGASGVALTFPIPFPSGVAPFPTFGGTTSGGHYYSALSATGMTVSNPGGTSFRYIVVGW